MKGFRYKPVGWKGESHRHYLAAKGIKTKQNRYYSTYAVGDMSLIAADGIGTAGAAAVPLLPWLLGAAVAYKGAEHMKKRKDKNGTYFYGKRSEFVDREANPLRPVSTPMHKDQLNEYIQDLNGLREGKEDEISIWAARLRSGGWQAQERENGDIMIVPGGLSRPMRDTLGNANVIGDPRDIAEMVVEQRERKLRHRINQETYRRQLAKEGAFGEEDVQITADFKKFHKDEGFR